MKNLLFNILLLLSFSVVSFSQEENFEFEKKMDMKTKSNSYSWGYKNLFMDYKFGVLNEFLLSKNKDYTYLSPNYSGDPDPDTVVYHDGGFSLTILSFTVEPRVNLYSDQQSALYLKSPLSFGISVFANQDKGFPNKKGGAFNLNLPILFGYAHGLNSTFTNTSKRGFAISGGIQYTLAPLVGGKTNIFSIEDLIPIGEPYAQRNKWFMPLVQLDYYKLKNYKKIKGYSLALCPYGTFYIKLGMNIIGTKK